MSGGINGGWQKVVDSAGFMAMIVGIVWACAYCTAQIDSARYAARYCTSNQVAP